MSERLWAWTIWLCCPVVLALLAIPTFGFTLVFLIPWWVGGPFYVSKEDCSEVGPYWDPPRPRKLWWREIR
jgi:hypothetical protein